MKENNFPFVNSKKKSWIKPIYTLFVVAIPSLLIWLFFSNDFFGNGYIEFWQKILIALGLIIGSFLITLLFIYLKILDINILTFVLPIAISFMAIFLTDALVPWARALIIIPFILLFIPVKIICNKIEAKIILKNKHKNNSNQKIIGYKKNN